MGSLEDVGAANANDEATACGIWVVTAIASAEARWSPRDDAAGASADSPLS